MMLKTHVCKDSDIDETAQVPEEKPAPQRTIRAEIINLWSIADTARVFFLSAGMFREGRKKDWRTSLCDFKALMDYSLYVHVGGKEKKPVNVPEMVKRWTDWIVVFSTAHSKESIDEAEYNIDNLLNPLLTAPVKQIREFYGGLIKALQEDERVPFFVWAMFSAHNEVIMTKAKDDAAIIRLKKKLASDIADLVEQHGVVRVDLQKALVGALMWRDPESLKEIGEDIKAGAKPRIKGRQSCLFLTVKRRGRNQKEHSIML